MKALIIFLHLVCLTIGISKAAGIECPHYCQCQEVDEEGHDVRSICLFTSITKSDTLSDVDAERTTWLHLACINSGPTSVLSDNLFSRFSNLIRVEISRCKFDVITDQTFPDFPASVTNFTVVSSRSSFFDDSWINTVRDFKHLDLASNGLEAFNEGFFCGLNSLLSLNISDNRIGHMRNLGLQCQADQVESCTSCLPNLESLDISKADINDLEVQLSWDFPKLKHFTAASCGIRSMSRYTFSGLNTMESLDLGWNVISDLNKNFFSDVSNLKYLSLAGNELFGLEPALFSPILGLTYLDISSNIISDLGIVENTLEFLKDLEKLEYLDLSSNFFFSVSSELLLNKPKLKKLRMLYCDLQEIDNDVFDSAPNLESLNFGGNVFATIEEETFGGLSELKELVLAANEIYFIDDYAFDSLTKLEYLYLFDNVLEELPVAFKVLVNLKELYISNNDLISLDTTVLKPLINLKEAYFDGNLLTEVPEKLFPSGSKLEVLDLSYNSITTIHPDAFVNLDELKYLWINTNFLKSIGTALVDLPNLVDLDITFNEISKLKAGIFPDSLESLNISLNAISHVETDAFYGMRNLEYISLTSNDIRHFPPTAVRTFGTKPPRIYMVGNTQHTCSCKSLKDNSQVTCQKGNIKHYNQLLPFSDYVQREDIVCAYKTDCSMDDCSCCGDEDCDCETQCPDGCTCYNNYDRSVDSINCQGMDMDVIPQTLPASITRLDLSGAKITSLEPDVFERYTEMKELFLNSSKVKSITRGAMNGLSNLEIFHLEFNSITSLEPLKLYQLDSLELVNLKGNNLTSMDLDLLDAEGASFAVSLGGNPWYCDCDFGHLFQAWLEKRSERVIDADDVMCSSVDLPGESLVSPGGSVLETDFSACGELPDDLFTRAAVRPSPQPKKSDDSNTTRNIAIGVVFAVIVLIVGIVLLVFFRSKLLRKKAKEPRPKLPLEPRPSVFENSRGRTWRNSGSQYSNDGSSDTESETHKAGTVTHEPLGERLSVQGLGSVPYS